MLKSNIWKSEQWSAMPSVETVFWVKARANAKTKWGNAWHNEGMKRPVQKAYTVLSQPRIVVSTVLVAPIKGV